VCSSDLVTGFTIDYSKCMFCALCVEPCPVDCIFMGATHDLSCYSRDGCLVDYSRLPIDVSWGRATLNPTAVAQSKVLVDPIHGGPNQ
jgi:NADH-quinone oxidoreductase subunit I